MKQSSIILLISIAILLAGGAYFFLGRSNTMNTAASAPTSQLPIASSSAPITSGASPEDIAAIGSLSYIQTYTDPSGRFSFKYPDGFVVNSVPGNDSEVLLVQDAVTHVGLQIVITPFTGGDIDITPAVIQADIPNLEISDPQPVLVGPSREGLAFMSDNPAFGGNSREVWYVYDGYLYQVSSYADFDQFVKGVFATWGFLKK